MKTLLRNTRIQIVLVVAIVTGSLFYAWWVTRYQPLRDEIAVLGEQQAEILAQNQSLRDELVEMQVDKVQASIDAYQSQADRVAALVPPEDEQGDIERRVTRAAEFYGIEIQSVRPVPNGTDHGYRTIGLQITALGNYHAAGAFMSHLLSLPTITQVRDVSIRATQRREAAPISGTENPVGQALSAQLVTVSFRLLGFFTMPEPVAPPPAAEGDAAAQGAGAAAKAGGEGAF